MSASQSAVLDVLGRYFEHALSLTPKTEEYPPFRVELDPELPPSPCDLDDLDEEGYVGWRPVLRQPPGDFARVEKAVGERLHPDIKAFFGGYWSYSFPVPYEERLSFMPHFCARKEEWTSLLQDLRSSLLEQRKEKLPLKVVIAGSDDDRFFIVENATGRVLLEEFGGTPRVLAPTLVDFLSRLPPPGGL